MLDPVRALLLVTRNEYHFVIITKCSRASINYIVYIDFAVEPTFYFTLKVFLKVTCEVTKLLKNML